MYTMVPIWVYGLVVICTLLIFFVFVISLNKKSSHPSRVHGFTLTFFGGLLLFFLFIFFVFIHVGQSLKNKELLISSIQTRYQVTILMPDNLKGVTADRTFQNIAVTTPTQTLGPCLINTGPTPDLATLVCENHTPSARN